VTLSPMGQMRSRAVILLALAAILLVAGAVLVGRSSTAPPGISEAAAEEIAITAVTGWETADPDAQLVDVSVDRYEDHDTFWRVSLRADLLVGQGKQPITYYYQIDVDKQTATPSLFGQG